MKNILGGKSLYGDMSLSHNQSKVSSSEHILLKSKEEIDQLRISAHLVRDLLNQLHKLIKPGINELDIASFCENYILIRGADPVLKTAHIYPHPVLISRNNKAFHGIPEDYHFVDGDIVTVDIVLLNNGWFGDGAWTYKVGHCIPSVSNLIDFSHSVIFDSVEEIKKVNDLNCIGKLICKECKKAGYRVVEEGAGHGIGRSIHEDPQILYTNDMETIELKSGMVFTIEPVISNSFAGLSYLENGTAFLDKRAYVSQFEHMIAVNDWGIEILTGAV